MVRDVASPALLSKKDSSRLLAVMDDLTRRYPSQDLESSIETYHRDYKKLAAKFGLPKVEQAIENLRIAPGRAFFPRPDEIAAELENMRLTAENNRLRSDGQRYRNQIASWREQWNSREEREWRQQMGFELAAAVIGGRRT